MNHLSQSPDIIVIGASAGGVSALQEIVRALPPKLPAAVFIVLHISPESKSMLGPLLHRASPLPVHTAEGGEAIRHGHIYVAPPDRHMTLEGDRVRVTKGPPQNRNRPSIDVLFRSAATAYGPRVIGIVLTGFLSDGTAGLQCIKDVGGTTIVQDPATALHPDMPASALRSVPVDHCVPLDHIPQLITRLSAQALAIQAIDPEQAKRLRLEADADLGHVRDLDRLGKPSGLVCPDCGGGLWDVIGKPKRFRCHVGHGYSLENLMSNQDLQVENALWAAARSLEDSSSIAQHLAEQWQGRGANEGHEVVEHFLRKSEESARHAAVIREVLGVPDSEAEHAT